MDRDSVRAVPGPPLTLHTLQPDQLGQRIDKIIGILADCTGEDQDQLLRRCDFLVLALPGIATDNDRHWAELALGSIGWDRPDQTAYADDTLCGLYAGALSPAGVCAVANTGASVLAIDQDQRSHKFDGWGAVIGDFGSGFEVAQALFRTINRQRDSGEDSPLFTDLMGYLHQREYAYVRVPQDLQLWFDNVCRDHPTEWRNILGDTASVVTAAARRDCPPPSATEIIRASALSMAETISLALRRYPALARLQVVCQGGMFEFSPLYRHTVFEAVAAAIGPVPRLGAYRPVVGALLLSLTYGKHFPSNSQTSDLLAAIERNQSSRSLLRPDLRGLDA